MTKDYVIYPRQSGKNMLRKALNTLVAIQELHKPVQPTSATAVYCAHCFEDGGYDGALYVLYPCETRKLADEVLDD